MADWGIHDLGTGESYDFDMMVEPLGDELTTDIEPKYVGANPIPNSRGVYPLSP